MADRHPALSVPVWWAVSWRGPGGGGRGLFQLVAVGEGPRRELSGKTQSAQEALNLKWIAHFFPISMSQM